MSDKQVDPVVPQAAPKVKPTEAEKLAEAERVFASKLPGAVMGEVVTRFPPEPSGYLHVGHAKAAMLNNFYAKYFKGKLLIRMDDTNPSKEKAEFEASILEDLAMLNVSGEKPTYTSDWFPQLQEAMEEMIKMGKAYCDDTEVDQMRKERFDGVESACRNNDVEENLRRWREMLAGSEEGQRNCVRAKIDMRNKNKALRDPVMYRVNVAVPHHRHGTTYKAYPCYDFACPLVDSWEGVTHALRTNEYADRIAQYYWVQDTMKVRRCIINEFSRLNFTNTVLSKRKLTWLVDTGVVSGWDDPRFPTVRGMRRRGLQVAALHEFLIEQGPSKNTNLMEWDKLWSKNQRILDPISKRFMAVAADAVEVELADVDENTVNKMRPLHVKNADLGEVPLCVTHKVFIEREDAQACEEGEEITLMRVGNIIVEKIVRNEENGTVEKLVAKSNFDGDVKKTKKKLHWVPESSAKYGDSQTFILREFDHIITKKKPEEGDSMEDIVNRDSVFDTECIAEPETAKLNEGDIIQFERRGYVRVDKIENGKRVMIAIPTGKMKAMSSLSTKVDAATLSRGGNTAKTPAPAATA